MKKQYKLKHIPTGLYYNNYTGRTQLSRDGGNVFDQLPQIPTYLKVRILRHGVKLTPIQKIIVRGLRLQTKEGYNHTTTLKTPIQWKIVGNVKTKPFHWEIEEINVKETLNAL